MSDERISPPATAARRSVWWCVVSLVISGIAYSPIFIQVACDEMTCLGAGLLGVLIMFSCLPLAFIAACVAAARGETPKLVIPAFLVNLLPVLISLALRK